MIKRVGASPFDDPTLTDDLSSLLHQPHRSIGLGYQDATRRAGLVGFDENRVEATSGERRCGSRYNVHQAASVAAPSIERPQYPALVRSPESANRDPYPDRRNDGADHQTTDWIRQVPRAGRGDGIRAFGEEIRREKCNAGCQDAPTDANKVRNAVGAGHLLQRIVCHVETLSPSLRKA